MGTGLQEPYFVLDVGTRKVTGMLVEREGDDFTIKHVCMLEHVERAMLDGQIHDIPKVAEVIGKIKKKIEQQAGISIEKASVAAAGRSLITISKKLERVIDVAEITEEMALSYEYEVLYAAQEEIHREHAKGKKYSCAYHCVGYSVQEILLDDYPIKNLVGQKGQKISVQVIATFLPRIVVDSLRSALKRVNLSIKCLTLEPIAALNIIVPPDMRKLNLALVDIGAGTSDIAITSGGTIQSYDMVPVAGDEITEILCSELLLDFPAAETLKRSLSIKNQATFTNILGQETTMQTEELLSLIHSGIVSLAQKISASILKNNGSAPQGVICVGGGSLTPNITGLLTSELKLAPGRVTIKGKEMLKMLPEKSFGFQGPDLVTPIGIAYCANKKDTLRFLNVSINGELFQVTDLRTVTVLDALLAAGVQPYQLYGRPGDGITIEINGVVKSLPGERGKMAEVYLDGSEVSLSEAILDGKEIKFIPAVKGDSPEKIVSDVVRGQDSLEVTVNGHKQNVPPLMQLNGRKISATEPLKDKDKLTIKRAATITDILHTLNFDNYVDYSYLFNRDTQTCKVLNGQVRLNGKPAELLSPINDGDVVTVHEGNANISIKELLVGLQKPQVSLKVNDKKLSFSTGSFEISRNGEQVSDEDTFKVEDEVRVVLQEKKPLVADILKELNFNRIVPPASSRLVIRKNGLEVKFSTPVCDGDNIELFWAKV